ncbi:DUF2490 domain-containing protein [Pontibacter diazotrophicus]|uniref:DUF2490 domain-containing protein n=1 Tax=Pontibacter diazotrophicus TaxID=1400979 RepID=A0A3D8LCM0_9BACT|nr:DUF2490 domain-containing protein [Pontibacter diazotrophicus]RDV15179.1 DUF2490 domain-containing protein [Pontibacter diazotrophicus]
MKKLYPFLLLVLLPLFTLAQDKVTAPAAIWPELQVNYGIGEDGLLFFRNQYRINTDTRYNDLRETGPLSTFERIELALGYEHTFTDHWRGGAMLRYAAEDYPKSAFGALFLRHNGSIKSLFFNKQVMAEYVNQENLDASVRFRLTGELGKQFPLRSKFITPSISYEALLLSGLGKDENMETQERGIDRTRLRINITYELTDKLRLTPYFMRQTNYYYALVSPVYNEEEQLIEEGYTTKRNRISPVVGLELKYTINKVANTASITY